MPGCENILAVTAGWLICVCGFCLCGIISWKSHVWQFLEMKELLNLLQRCWLGRAGPIPWTGSSCNFTLLDIIWSNVTEHIYILPFVILLTGHAEIEHVLGPAVFLDFTQYKVVIPFQCFGITSWSHLQRSRCPRRNVLKADNLHILDVC
jgi:hypothetical protein